MYLVLAWAFWRGVDAVRIPAIAWAIAILYSMVVHLWMEVFGDHPAPNLPLLLAIYLPYVVLPIAVLYRLRSATPFSRDR